VFRQSVFGVRWTSWLSPLDNRLLYLIEILGVKDEKLALNSRGLFVMVGIRREDP
jgi:hypothetical protein